MTTDRTDGPVDPVLVALATKLGTQAKAQGKITVDESVLLLDAAHAIAAAFMLDAGTYLTITGVTAADILEPSTREVRVSAGAAILFNKTSFAADLVFTLDGAGALQTLIVLTPSPHWTFSDSFPQLDVYPFDSATLTIADARFVYSSQPCSGYAAWLDKPQSTIDLQKGLNFAGWLTLTLTGSALAVLADVLGASTSIEFFGPFTLDPANPYPVTSLTGKIDSAKTLPFTKDFTASGLALVVEIAAPGELIQDIRLRLTASTDDLDLSVALTPGVPGLAFVAQPKAGHSVTAIDILKLPGGSNFESFIPAELSDQFSQVELRALSVTLSAPGQIAFTGLSIGSAAGRSWPLIPGVVELDDISLELGFVMPLGGSAVTIASLRASCTLPLEGFTGAFEFRVALDNGAAGAKWEICAIRGTYVGTLTLGELVAAFPGNPGPVPQELVDIVFGEFGANVTKLADGYSYAVHGRCDSAFPMLDCHLVASLSFVAQYSKGGYDVDLRGALGIGEQSFALALELGRSDGGAAASGKLSASWAATGSDYLQFEDIATAFGFPADEIPDIPPGLDLALRTAALLYDYDQSELGIGLQSANYGGALFAAIRNPANANRWQFFFGIAAQEPIDLMRLPLVESFAGSHQAAAISNLQVVISSQAIDVALAGSLNDLIGRLGTPSNPSTPAPAGTYPEVPTANGRGMAAGVAFSMDIVFADTSVPLVLGAGGGGPMSLGAQALSSTPPPSGLWVPIDKSIGPVSFARFGVQYDKGALFFLLDASLGLSSLTLTLDGLGIGSPLSSFSPQPHLDGVSVSFSGGPVTITGGLLGVPSPSGGVSDEYVGEVVVTAEPYVMGGLASYARVNGQPSVFAFAQLQGEIGGLPAFFVTSFMGGFGYNSQLTLPAPDEVYAFPFVAGLDDPSVFGSTNPSAGDVLSVLMGTSGETAVVTPATGGCWVAGGLTFRSFELVVGRALAVVTFGREFEVALLGLASLRLPQGASSADAYAYVELQLEVQFKPEEGVFSALASLTPNSFLLTRDCHLTGGFAFSFWFGANRHAGDFVVTAGGYHPAFQVPTWYPQVAPVAFNWAVSSSVTVKGAAYFALTPTAGMAGGSLEVLFQSGDLNAWFTAYANLMIRWKPFYFTATIGISIGASYRLNLLFTSVTFSVELGATLDLWGPPTGGVAEIHWVIISFSIPFGRDEVDPAAMTLAWPDFKTLLPSKPTAQPKALPDTAADPAVLLTLDINRGLSRRDADDGWIVRADELVFTTASAVPLTSVLLNQPAGKSTPCPRSAAAPLQIPVALPAGAPRIIQIRPMKQSNVTSIQTLSLKNLTEPCDMDLGGWPTPVVQSRNLPQALWGAPLDDLVSPEPAAATIKGLPVGVQLTAPPPTLGPTIGPVDPATLVDPLGSGQMPLQPSAQPDPNPKPIQNAAALGDIMSLAASPARWDAQVRALGQLVIALGGLGAAPPADAPLAQLASQAGTLFTQAPLYLGQAAR